MATQDERVPMTTRGYQFLMDELKRLIDGTTPSEEADPAPKS